MTGSYLRHSNRHCQKLSELYFTSVCPFPTLRFSMSSCFNPGGVLEDKGTISVLFWSHANDFQSIMDWLCCSVSVSTINNRRLWQNVIRNISTIISFTFTHAQGVLTLLEAHTNTRCGYFRFLYRYSWLNFMPKRFYLRWNVLNRFILLSC